MAFFDEFKDFIEACKDCDTTDFREHQRQKKICKYQKKVNKRRKREIAALTVAHYSLNKVNGFIKDD